MLPQSLLALALFCLVHFSALAAAQDTPGLKFLGCFADQLDRDLPVFGGSGEMSRSKCYHSCRSKDFLYFGLQIGNECWCGNSYGKYGQLLGIDCHMHCTAEAQVSCGAGWKNSVYSTGLSTELPDKTYVGCFFDNEDRDLPVKGGSGSMSIWKCYVTCKAKGLAYFGVQSGDECWCGNSYGKHGERPKSECNLRCTGEATELCGADWKNSIFTTGIRPPPGPRPKYLGCFADNENRDLPVLGGRDHMTIVKCLGLCHSKGFAYFGLQAGNECFCGSIYGRYGLRDQSECNHRCTGQESDFCGAWWRNSVYAIVIS